MRYRSVDTGSMRTGLVIAVLVAMTGATHADVVTCGQSAREVPGVALQALPPAAPVIRSFEIDVDRGGFVTFMFVGGLAADATLYFDVLRTGGEPVSIAIPPTVESSSTYRTCMVPAPLVAGEHVRLRVTAIDRGGQTSAPVSYEADVREHHKMTCGMGYFAVIIVGGGALIVLLVLVLIVQIVRASIRARMIADATSEPISLLVVERLARRAQFRAGLAGALWGAAAVVLLRTESLEVFALAPVLLGLIALHGYLAAHRILKALDNDARAEAKGCMVIVIHDDGQRAIKLEVSPRAMRSAMRWAVPRSAAS